MSGKSRIPILLGLSVAGAGGYYLYAAGGDPKVAQKKIEHDAASASAKLKSELPGSGKEAKTQGEEWAQKAGSKLDNTVDEARAQVKAADAQIGAKMSEADSKLHQLKSDGISKLEETRKTTGKELKDTVNTFDKTVEKKTAEAKSGISSWFGFGGSK
ncbi:hypothetical protein MMC12_003998 [Toensbergia leucococca]|nr:hypothetical protein [Toensbergia leucococca]